MSDRMLFADGFSGRVGVGLGEDVLTYEALDVSSIPRHTLVSNHVIWS